MFQILPVNEKGILAFKASGKLTDADYQQFLPILERLIRESGRISLYIELEDFEGWEAKAAWADVRFGLVHDRDFKRIAVVGDNTLEHAGIALSNFFTHTDMRFFDKQHTQAAWEWLEEKPRQEEPPQPGQPYRKLLLATDFSPHSERAAHRAVELAGHYRARLDVLHIVEEMAFSTNWYDPVIDEIPLRNEAREQQVETLLRQFAERTKLGTDAVLNIEWGYPKWSIVSWAREKAVDLIVMGASGRHGIGRLLGSVSGSVLHQAPCDVLIVRP